MQALDMVPRQSQMPLVTSWQASSEMRLCLEKSQADNHKVPPMPPTVHNLSQIEIAKPVHSVSIYPCI
jgi:hypothetical protein